MIPDFSQIGWVPPRRAPIEVKGQRMTPEGLVSIDAVSTTQAPVRRILTVSFASKL
ncbi:hypothetical protein LHFGNBLO_006537 (plasmid) [Mesorhizobium sp. AR10]|uniref:hypothetical protein n=1 Tax=Mesorhizobium sp. AR10 TaxID=2865839 RepID=UPI00215E3078|nr:hypothetical protein [Mesorhizobium sp. AR10]UVK35681.1 hypothetical protein LHFGNBLO_006537 [Mesorhizobium sp. AR10]